MREAYVHDHPSSVAEPKPVRRVVIAGGGTAGWMAAAALAKTLGKVLDVTLVESEDIGTIGVGESTIPTLVTFHRLLEIAEQEFMAATQATIKLGIEFENWLQPGHRYFHSFGTTGKDHWSAGFQHFWLKGRARGVAGEYGDYCLELAAARLGRFAHLPRNGMNYAYHIDASRYAQFLRGFAERHGARRVEGRIVDVATDPDSGHIASLRLADGSDIAGDLFIDCTGFRALLIGKTLNIGYADWSHWLLNDSALAAQTAATSDPPPYTRVVAGKAGWQWRIPLQHRVGNGSVYASRYLSDGEARADFLAGLDGEPLREPLLLRFRPGQRLKCWSRNCIALGLASGFIEPLESTAIHLVQRGITRLLQAFPHVITPSAIDEYNARTDAEIQHTRDFVVLHYHATRRRDNAYWRTVAGMEIPPTLRHRIELFRETGTVFHVPTELFAENSWVQVMMGQGITPLRHHPAADMMGDAELTRFLGGIRGHVDTTVRQLPAHRAYLDSYCPAPAPG
jgi:tryptophan 7-halogenase